MDKKYLLKLYIVGGTSHSERVVAEVRKICEEELDHHYVLEVIDVLEHPALAEDERIIATPTLIKVLPEPLRRVFGDLSDREAVVLGLDLRPLGDTPDTDVP
ncbi:MAG: circadian clock KaiB family protein [Gammaproteobacteria bacterium]|nr:circadian clock KaiB family protein [Gammaproteobacteria bacterium]